MAKSALPLLSKSLGKLFAAPRPRPLDRQRKPRERAKALAAELGCEIEPMRPGFNVWPPASITDEGDPFAGDHYCNDWSEAAAALETYRGLVAK